MSQIWMQSVYDVMARVHKHLISVGQCRGCQCDNLIDFEIVTYKHKNGYKERILKIDPWTQINTQREYIYISHIYKLK